MLAGWIGCGTVLAQANAPVSGTWLADELRKGGYVVYFRHTHTLPDHAWEQRTPLVQTFLT